MYCPSLKEFLILSKQGNVIPVYKEINADLDTPASAFLKIKKNEYAFLLESVEGQEKIARYSFLGSNPALVFKSKSNNIEIIDMRNKSIRRFKTTSDPLNEIKTLMQDFRPVSVKGLPRFYGGFVGYMGYDVVRFFEKIPDKNPDDLKLPDSIFILTDTILIFDHVNHTIKIVTNIILPKGINTANKIVYYHKALLRITQIQNDFKRPLKDKKIFTIEKVRKINITSNFTKSQFQDIVNKAKVYIRKGDIIQVVLSQRFKTRINKGHFDIYRNLRSLNPSPYMFFLRLKDITLIGASPEMLVRCESGLVQTRPIAGTRPRGRTEEEDKKLMQQLLNDKKEKAEHIMLVDLGRNDLGRVCRTGKIEVGEFMVVEKYSHVMHMVTEIKGLLNTRYDIFDVLRACFPAGTVSGSPKIRAMEIIDELETVKRGPYAGCVGYFSFSHNLDTCITIRTIVVKGDYAYVQAGAGIVADSIPGKEYLETVNKAKALIEAIVR